MTAQEKSTVYELLKTASDCMRGYKSPDFSDTTPDFSETIIMQEQEKPAVSSMSVQNIQESDQQKTSSAAPSPVQSQATPQKVPAPVISVPETVSAQGNASLVSLADKILQCTRCPLAKSRNKPVTGCGCATPYVLIIGEGPGFEEEMKGYSFAGPEGQLMDKMLGAIELSRNSNTYLTNIVKCRTPQNRNPYSEEADACSSFLQAQIALLKPKMILCTGTAAAKGLLKTELGVTKLRGKFFEYAGIPVAVTYHPAHILRDASLKRPAWEDLKQFKLKLLELCPDYQKSYVPLTEA